mmetsp:Transcript_18978/g.54180  ORF Transcript_18978/g.54180 Transcript_18978/m.54180 type:complete len:276 (-) Transcript_18978:2-829(-)
METTNLKLALIIVALARWQARRAFAKEPADTASGAILHAVPHSSSDGSLPSDSVKLARSPSHFTRRWTFLANAFSSSGVNNFVRPMFRICQCKPSSRSLYEAAPLISSRFVSTPSTGGANQAASSSLLRGAASSLGWASAGLSTAGASKRRSMVSLVRARRRSCSTVKTGGLFVPSPVTTLPRARSSMVEDAQVGRRLARAGPLVRAWGASAVAAPASAITLFSIMLTFGPNGRRGTVFRRESCSCPCAGPVGEAARGCVGAQLVCGAYERRRSQ